jgi:3-isopropylmalate dehydrogenase
MSTYQIAALPGDGIGPEVMEASMTVLRAVQRRFRGLDLTFDFHEAGAGNYRQTGEAISASVMQACMDADAVLLAAIGLPDVRKPDGTEVQPDMMMGLRRTLGLYAAVRPVKLYPGVECPLKTAERGIDLVILRENLEGLFASFGGGCQLNDQVASDTLLITRAGTERIVDFAFRLARRRNGRPGDHLRKVTCVDKANVFRSYAFFRKVFFEIAEDYPDIQADAAYVDAMSLHLVVSPSDWDVLVMENQFGDILSDLGAAIVGGLGLAPSAEIGQSHALFQPSHGTAPDIAGRDIANPVAMILSAAMMLDWLGLRYDDSQCLLAAEAIERGVVTILQDRTVRTRDLGGRASTMEMAHAIAESAVGATSLSKSADS